LDVLVLRLVWTIDGMTHSFPVAPPSSGLLVLDVGVFASAEIAGFWGYRRPGA
jgi:hypothetical protein